MSFPHLFILSPQEFSVLLSKKEPRFARLSVPALCASYFFATGVSFYIMSMYCETQSRTKNIAQFVPGVRFLARQRDSYTPFLHRVNCAFTIALLSVFPYLRPRISTPKTILCPMSFITFVILSLCPKKNCASFHLRAVIHSIHDSFVEIRGGLSYHLRYRFHTTFVTVFILLSFYQNFPITCQSTNSSFSQLSRLSQPSQLSRLSQPSQLSLPSPKIHGLFNDNIWRHQNIRACVAMAVGRCDKSGIFIL